MSNMGAATSRVGAAAAAVVLVAAAASAASQAVSHAEPAGKKVTYTVVAQDTFMANIYYMANQPPNKAAYDADSAKYLMFERVPLTPGVPWVKETTLADPTQWALVSGSGALRQPPKFHCEIAIDGVVATTSDGDSGVQCALRPW